LTKTDDVLLELGRISVAYMSSVFPFQYNNKTYHLINNYVASPYLRCDVCGNYPTFEISVIESEDGVQRLHVGNNCIDRMTGRAVSEWFRSFRKKRENIMANRKYIDKISLILNVHDVNDLSFQMPSGDVEKLRIMLEQMCNGLNLTTGQEQIANCYINRKITV
jgi:hypothetical protein